MQKRLLLVDSDPKSLASLQAILPSHEFSVSVAHSAAEGLRKACEEKPHCIVFEVDMLSSSGTIMYARLRRNAATRHIPAIVYSDVTPRYGTGICCVSKKQDAAFVLAAVRERLHLPHA